MKLHKFYSYFYAIKEIKKQNGKLEKNGWIINDNLYLINWNLYFLPIIKEINGNFSCNLNRLTTLKGSPQKVGGYFVCNNNQLITLRDAPQEIGDNFWCYNNPIKDYSELDKIKIGGRTFK